MILIWYLFECPMPVETIWSELTFLFYIELTFLLYGFQIKCGVSIKLFPTCFRMNLNAWKTKNPSNVWWQTNINKNFSKVYINQDQLKRATYLKITHATQELGRLWMIQIARQILLQIASDITGCEHAKRQLLLLFDLNTRKELITAERDSRGSRFRLGIRRPEPLTSNLNLMPLVVVELSRPTLNTIHDVISQVDQQTGHAIDQLNGHIVGNDQVTWRLWRWIERRGRCDEANETVWFVCLEKKLEWAAGVQVEVLELQEGAGVFEHDRVGWDQLASGGLWQIWWIMRKMIRLRLRLTALEINDYN